MTGQVEALRRVADGINPLSDASHKHLNIMEGFDETKERLLRLDLFRAAGNPEDIRFEYLRLEQEVEMALLRATAALTSTLEK